MRLEWRLLNGKIEYFFKKISLFNFMWKISNYEIEGISWPKKNVQNMGKFLEMKPDVKMMERENIGNM